MRGTRKDFDEPTRMAVEDQLSLFLDLPQRKTNRGGFAAVLPEDVQELDDLILALVKYRYAPDSDGDRPLRWSLCDWTTHQPHNFQYLPHSDENGDKDEQRLDIALLNLDIAMSEVKQCRDSLRYTKQQQVKK